MLCRPGYGEDPQSVRVIMVYNHSFLAWRVLAGVTVGLALGFSNVAVALFGLFVLPLSEAFGWGRGQISAAIFGVNAVLIVASPFLGLVLDRIGSRRVILPSIALFGVAIGAIALVHGSLLHFYVAYMLAALLGIGTIPAAYTRIAIAWFDDRRGLAVGVAMAGVGLGAMLLPPLIQWLIGRFGWQAGYLGLAALIVLVAWPVAFWLLIDEPGQAGHLRDGHVPAPDVTPDGELQLGLTFRECLKSSCLWKMAGGFALLGLATSGIMAHLVPLLRDRGVSGELAALGASTLGLALVIGRVVCGLLLDRYPAPRVVVAFLLGPVAGLAMLGFGAAAQWAFIATLLIGIGIGAELDFMSYLVSRYLGHRAYGSNYGLLYSAFALGAAFGPMLMGSLFEIYGTYDQALRILCAASVASLIPFATLGAYPALASAPALPTRPTRRAER